MAKMPTAVAAVMRKNEAYSKH